MMHRKLRTTSFIALFALLVPAVAWAQQNCGQAFTAQYALVNVWNQQSTKRNVYGQQVLDRATRAVVIFDEQKPVEVTTGRSFSMRGSYFNRRCGSNWGFGIQGRVFNLRAPSQDVVLMPPGESPVLHGVRMNGQMVFPAADTRTESGSAPLIRVVDSQMYYWDIDALGVYSMVEDPNSHGLSLVLGARYSRYQNSTLNASYQNIFVEDFFGMETESGTIPHHYDIDYTIQENVVAEYSSAFGPVVGLSGYLRTGKRLLLRGSLRQSVVLGTADHAGAAIKLFDSYASVGSGEDLQRVQRLKADLKQNSFGGQENTAVSMTDIEADLVVAITPKIAINAGGFISLFNNAPGAAFYNAETGQWNSGQSISPVFAGLTLGAVYRMKAF